MKTDQKRKHLQDTFNILLPNLDDQEMKTIRETIQHHIGNKKVNQILDSIDHELTILQDLALEDAKEIPPLLPRSDFESLDIDEYYLGDDIPNLFANEISLLQEIGTLITDEDANDDNGNEENHHMTVLHIPSEEANSDPVPIPHAYLGISTDDPGGHNIERHSFIVKRLIQVNSRKFIKTQVNAKQLIKKTPDYNKLCPYFGWAPTDVVQSTFENTTQYARQENTDGYMKKHYRTRFPALNVARRHEPVATDTVFSNTKAVDDGSTCAQIFIGRNSYFADVYGMKSDKEFVNTLEDVIRKRGAMDKLISDQAMAEISKRVLDLLRAYCIDHWQSEAYHQNQNFCERRYETIKEYVNKILDRTGAPPECWLLCLEYVCYLLNRLSHKSLDNQTPYFRLTGQMADISALTHFYFYEEVYFLDHETSEYPSKN